MEKGSRQADAAGQEMETWNFISSRIWRCAPAPLKRLLRSRFVRLVFIVDMLFQLTVWVLELALFASAVLHGCEGVVGSSLGEVDKDQCGKYIDMFAMLFDVKNTFHFVLTGAIFFGKAVYVWVALLVGKRLAQERQAPVCTSCTEAESTEETAQISRTPSGDVSPLPHCFNALSEPSVPTSSTSQRSWASSGLFKWFIIDSWSMAASRDVYEETAHSVQALFIDLLVLTVISTVLNLIPAVIHSASAGMDPAAGYSQRVCGKQLCLCTLGTYSWRTLSILAAYLRQLVQMSFFILPSGVYHHLSFRAAKKTGWSRYMYRVIIEVPLLEMLIDIPFIILTLMTVPGIARGRTTKADVEIFTVMHLVAICWNLIVTLMLLEVDVRLWRRIRPPEPGKADLYVPDHLALDVCHSTAGSSSFRSAIKKEGLLAVLRPYYAPQAGSRRSRQTMISGLVCVAMLSVVHGSSYLYYGLSSLFRLYVCFLLFVQRDGESNFDDLRASGGGFGLLVDARDFTCALRAVLDGKEYTRKLRQYKGTMFRMYDTLTVSYRWQPEKKPIGREQGVNMSPWQMQKLLEGIEMSGCIYVWMDVLCIPQDGSQLQRTLLARMMAVYSSAKACLVLRSCELPGNRYHQRAWTLQEWCTCSSMVVSTQEPSDRRESAGSGLDSGQPLKAIARKEVKMYFATRRWQLHRKVDVRPFWLYGTLNSTLTNSDIRVVWRDYVRLSSLLSCKEPLDKIRAVFPLLWNTPTSSHYDLQKLVGEVWDRVLDLGLNHVCKANEEALPGNGEITGSPHPDTTDDNGETAPVTHNLNGAEPCMSGASASQVVEAGSRWSVRTANESVLSRSNSTAVADALLLMHGMMLGNEVIRRDSDEDFESL